MVFLAGFICGGTLAHAATPLPAPVVDEPRAEKPEEREIVLAGGCFWGVEAVFRHTKGVIRATSGYSGGSAKDATYDRVSTGATGHAEAVRVIYDARAITAAELLQIFFSVAHDPTEVNRQGPDIGTQYRSAVFFTTPEQEKAARAYIRQLNDAKVFPQAIATQLARLEIFYPAEEHHQDYVARHPAQPYVAAHDLPKLQRLKELFPDRFTP